MRKQLASAALLAALAAPLACSAQAAAAGENVEQVRNTVLNLIRALVDQGVLAPAKAQEMLRQSGLDPALLAAPQVTPAAPPAAAATDAPPPVVRVPYVPEIVKDQIRDEVKQEVLAQARAERWGDPGSLPAWLSRFSLNGDLRLRYQVDTFADDNAAVSSVDSVYQLPSGTTRNDSEARMRMRVRARLGANVRLSEQFSAGARLATVAGDDATTNPLSYNVDLGRYGRALSTGWDLAFLQWDPTARIRISGGRTVNPYYGTDLIWASDLTFDGIFVRWQPRYSFDWNGLFTIGAHPLRISEPSTIFNTASDQWLYAVQAGTNWTAADESTLNFAAAYYYFSHLQGELNAPGSTSNNAYVPLFRQRGNTMFNLNFVSNVGATPAFGLASKFQVADVAADFEYAGFDPLRLWLRLDWVRNFGFDPSEIRRRIGPAIAELPTDAARANGVARPRVNGYLVSVQAGDHQLARLGDWQWFGGYRYLERDAVPDAFTSPDYRLGGTDNRSAFTGVNLGLAPAVSLTLRYVSGRSIDAVPKYSVDTWFLDLNGRF